MKFLRDTYRPGPDRLAYVAVARDAASVVARVYGPGHRPRSNAAKEVKLFKLEEGVFALDFVFKELGNYIFVIEEDGTVQTILNAKVYV
jgi:hypothetical protein